MSFRSSKELLNLKKSKGNLGKFSFSKSLNEMDFFLKSGTKARIRTIFNIICTRACNLPSFMLELNKQ